MTTAILYIASALMLAFGAYSFYKLLKKSSLINASKSWPAVTAVIIKKEVVRRVSSKGQAYYFPELDYQYSVMGSEFNQHARLNKAWSQASAQKILDAIGSSIEVHYNPEKLTEHTNGYEKVNAGDYLLIVVLLILGVVGIVIQLK